MSGTGEDVDIVAAVVIDLIIEIELHASVLGLSQVVDKRGEAGGVGNGDVGHHAFGLRDVIVKSPREPIVEEAEVKSDVGVVFLLPVELFVGKSLDIGSDAAVVGTAAVIHEGGHGVVGAEALVAREAVGGAQFQPVDPSETLDEGLIVNVPSAAYRPERSPAVVVSCF